MRMKGNLKGSFKTTFFNHALTEFIMKMWLQLRKLRIPVFGILQKINDIGKRCLFSIHINVLPNSSVQLTGKSFL